MSVIKSLLIITIMLLAGFFSGCMFFRQTEFSVLSLVIDDDELFPYIKLGFNTSDTVVLSLTGPQQNNLFSDTVHYGTNSRSLYLANYRETPAAGTYLIKATDTSEKTIYESQLTFEGVNLSFTTVSEDWWVDQDSLSIVALHFTIHNAGDLPCYPHRITVTNEERTKESLLLPRVVLPAQSQEFSCFLYLDDLKAEETILQVSISDKHGAMLIHTTHIVSPGNPIPSWVYQWNYLGAQRLRIPDMTWFGSYYQSLTRLYATDYTAYVFDAYDDEFLSFVSSQLLLPIPPHDDIHIINHIASFVQNLEYAKDDPLDDTYEYPQYPLETLKLKQGDCEDKAILTAALLHCIGYNVSLIRLPNHMAVGVSLNQTILGYSYYLDQYYFLETTAPHTPLGRIPPEYQDITDTTVYPLSLRPILVHNWRNATRYTLSTGKDYVTVTMIIENLGSANANNVIIKGAFYDINDQQYNSEIMPNISIPAGEKRIVDLIVHVPTVESTILKTQLYIDTIMVHEQKSSSVFP